MCISISVCTADHITAQQHLTRPFAGRLARSGCRFFDGFSFDGGVSLVLRLERAAIPPAAASLNLFGVRLCELQPSRPPMLVYAGIRGPDTSVCV